MNDDLSYPEYIDIVNLINKTHKLEDLTSHFRGSYGNRGLYESFLALFYKSRTSDDVLIRGVPISRCSDSQVYSIFNRKLKSLISEAESYKKELMNYGLDNISTIKDCLSMEPFLLERLSEEYKQEDLLNRNDSYHGDLERSFVEYELRRRNFYIKN